MVNHNQMVSNMLYELEPNYDNLSDERKQNLKDLVELYLDPNTPDTRKEVIMNQLQTTKLLAESLHRISNSSNQNDNSHISQEMMNKAWKEFCDKSKRDNEKQKGILDPINSLVLLCYTTNETILKMQGEQQAILQSIIVLQKQQMERETKMLHIINQQQIYIQTLKEKDEKQQELIALLQKDVK